AGGEKVAGGKRGGLFVPESARRGRFDGDPRLRSGKRAIDRVGDGDRLRTGRAQRGAESADAVVAWLESVVAREGRLAVAAGEADGAAVAGGGVAEFILRGDGEGAGHTRRAGRWEASDAEARGRRRSYGDSGAAGDGAVNGVGGSDRTAVGGAQDDLEGLRAVVRRGEGVGARQYRIRVRAREPDRPAIM